MRNFIYFIAFFIIIIISCKQRKQPTVIVQQEDLTQFNSLYQQSLFAKKISEEALNRSTFKETKDFAGSIIKANETILGQLEEIAGRQSLELPLDISELQFQNWKGLMKNKGAEFDQEYVEMANKLNVSQIESLTRLANSAKDPEIKQTAKSLTSVFANNNETVLQLQQLINNKEYRDSLNTSYTLN